MKRGRERANASHGGEFMRFARELGRSFDQLLDEQIDSLDLLLDLADEPLGLAPEVTASPG